MLGLEAQPGSVTEGAVSPIPTQEDLRPGEQLLLASLTPWEAVSPALPSQMSNPSLAAPEVKRGGLNSCVPLQLHPVVPALLAGLKASANCVVFAPCIFSWCFQG